MAGLVLPSSLHDMTLLGAMMESNTRFAALKPSATEGIVIDIDEDMAKLISEINDAPDFIPTDFASSLKDVVLDAILGPFGLSSAAFDDQDGGSITTLRNFEEGCASKRDQDRLANWRAANLGAIDRHGANSAQDYDAKIKRERKRRFQSDEALMDEYRPGVELPRDGRAQRDHIVSTAEIERSAKAQLGQSRERRVETATHDDNLAWTNGPTNQSKGAKRAKDWMDEEKVRDGNQMKNAQYFDVDKDKMAELDERARKSVGRMQSQDLARKQAKEMLVDGAVEGATIGARQIVGLILKDVAVELIDEIRLLLRKGFHSTRAVVRAFKLRCVDIGRKLLQKWRVYLEQTGLSILTGFFSTAITFLINNVIKTLKNVVTLIRESALAAIRSIHLALFPPADMSGSEIAAQVLSLLAGGVVAAGTILLEELVQHAVASIALLAPISGEISKALVAILAGVLGLLTVYVINGARNDFALRRKLGVDRERRHTVELLHMKRSYLMLDLAADRVSGDIHRVSNAVIEFGGEAEELQSESTKSIGAYSASIERFQMLSLSLNK